MNLEKTIKEETEKEKALREMKPLSNAKLKTTLLKLKTLKKSELIHLIEMCPTTIESFRKNRIHQKAIEKKHSDLNFACWDCSMIARKLGLECSIDDLDN